jgi:hypothetical protein
MSRKRHATHTATATKTLDAAGKHPVTMGRRDWKTGPNAEL